jgi:DNA-binding transcriptional MerR regulator
MQIGDLARLTHISVRMLRHYDEIDLFKPALIRENTYREYSISQLAVLNRILALKDLGFSLEQIRSLVQEGFAAQRLRDLLELRRAELETHISQESERLNKVEQRLLMMEKEKSMTNYTVSVKSLPAQLVASVRDAGLDVFNEIDGEKRRSMQRYFETLFSYLKNNNLDANTPFTVIAHPPLEENSSFADVEIIRTLSRKLPESEHVRVYELPATPMTACLEYVGLNDWQVIEGQAMPALYAWIEENGFKAIGPLREEYRELDGLQDGTPCVIELQIPIAQA